MTFFVHFHASLLILSFATLSLLISNAAGALNDTLRLDSSSVSFSSGWLQAQFGESGDRFAFATGANERMQVQLPRE